MPLGDCVVHTSQSVASEPRWLTQPHDAIKGYSNHGTYKAATGVTPRTVLQ